MFSYCSVWAIYKELKVLPLLEVSLNIFPLISHCFVSIKQSWSSCGTYISRDAHVLVIGTKFGIFINSFYWDHNQNEKFL